MLVNVKTCSWAGFLSVSAKVRLFALWIETPLTQCPSSWRQWWFHNHRFCPESGQRSEVRHYCWVPTQSQVKGVEFRLCSHTSHTCACVWKLLRLYLMVEYTRVWHQIFFWGGGWLCSLHFLFGVPIIPASNKRLWEHLDVTESRRIEQMLI